MANKTTTQPQQTMDAWKNLVDFQFGQLNASYENIAAMHKKSVDQQSAWVDQYAKFVKDSVSFANTLTAEWQKSALEANARTASFLKDNSLG